MARFPKTYADRVARLRVAFGIVLGIAFIVLSEPDQRSMIAGVPVSIAGLLLRAWAAGHLSKNEQLATSGPYAFIRNPLYAGTLLVAAGLVIAGQSVLLAVVFAAVFLLVYLPVIELEEQHLHKLFRDFGPYAERVPLFVPRGRRIERHGHFRVELYMRNEEYRASVAYAVALAILLWKMLRIG